jgi:hypothetical protein
VAQSVIVVVVAKEVEAVAQRRTRPNTVKAEEEKETQYVILAKEEEAR